MVCLWKTGSPRLKTRSAFHGSTIGFDYGEERILTLGLNENLVLFVVSTELDETLTRIISVRKAEDDEIEQYDLGRP
jgi:uncharacterized DUF497 family protein